MLSGIYCIYVTGSGSPHPDAVVECGLYDGYLITVDSQLKSDALAAMLSGQGKVCLISGEWNG